MSWLNYPDPDCGLSPSSTPQPTIQDILNEQSTEMISLTSSDSARSAPIPDVNTCRGFYAPPKEGPSLESKDSCSLRQPYVPCTCLRAKAQAIKTESIAQKTNLVMRMAHSFHSRMESSLKSQNEMAKALEVICMELECLSEMGRACNKSPKITPTCILNTTAASMPSNRLFGAFPEHGTQEERTRHQQLGGIMGLRAQGSLGKPSLQRSPTLYDRATQSPPVTNGFADMPVSP